MFVEANGYRIALPDWVVDQLDVSEDGSAHVSGWILPSHPDATLTVSIGGVAAETTFSEAPEALQQVWASVAHLTTPRMFSARAPEAPDTDTVEVLVSDDGAVRPLNGWYFPQREAFALPDATRRTRVHGTDAAYRFQRNGCSNYQRLKQIATRFDLPRPARVLDWGCGAGAVARYALSDNAWDYAGADIDPDNIGWCSDNLSADRFTVIKTDPPTPFADARFDLIFGVSVMTHLREADQDKWLDELRRLLSPQGVLLLSVHGGQAEAKLAHAVPALAEHGFVFGEAPHQIGELIGQPLYYGTAYHRESYVRAHWTHWFEIVDYLPGALGHQDLVAMRQRA